MYYFHWSKSIGDACDYLKVYKYVNSDSYPKNIDQIDFMNSVTIDPNLEYVCDYSVCDIDRCLIDMNMKDHYENTALHYFAVKGCQKVLDHPQCNTVKNIYGFTPLQSMMYAGFDCSKYLDKNVKIKRSAKCKPEVLIDDIYE
jgi:hypothetical protein